MDKKDFPVLSIITVVYNGKEDFARTLDSVKAQSYSHLEYIVIDGGSNDGTAELILENKASIAKSISEKDAGIYDAMNKGLRLASGEYVLFLNAGDLFYSPDVLENIFSELNTKPDAIYGETMFVDEQYKEIGLMGKVSSRPFYKIETWKDMRYGMVFCHQSFLVKRELAPPYNTDHIYSADIDWIIRCLKNCITIHMYAKPIACFKLGGFSSKNHAQSLWDRFVILSRHFGTLPTLVNHMHILTRPFFKRN